MTVIITSGSIAPDWPAYEGLSLCLTYLCLCPFGSYLYANRYVVASLVAALGTTSKHNNWPQSID